MLDKEKHQLIMGQILKDLYTNPVVAPLLGFKGGTCAYYFYGLPRFSVDMDFDLLEESQEKKKIVFSEVGDILARYGTIKNSYIKHFTIFFLLSYGDEDHNIKFEINTRQLASNIKEKYVSRDYFSIPVLIAKKDYIFASKLSALSLRKKIAMRDVYDTHYFLKNNWDLDKEIIKLRVSKPVDVYLEECIQLIEGIKDRYVLSGLGELVGGEAEKDWVRRSLRSDTVFLLRNYLSAIG